MIKNAIIRAVTHCRACGYTRLHRVLTLGPTPLANAFLSEKQIDLPEAFYPLDVYFCTHCNFVELGHVVSPKKLFKDYVYVSSTSPVFVKHFQQFAQEAYSRFRLNQRSLVVDIGSNDGILLIPFKARGVRVLGIEPAKHIAQIARRAGITTLSEFFSTAIAKQIVQKYGKADVVTATNVFAHIDDLQEVIEGIRIVLDDEGVFIIEAPYLVDFIQKNYFDLVYHEHLSYWAVGTLMTLLHRFGMAVFDVQKVSSHGGSIRVFVKKSTNKKLKVGKNVEKFLRLEKKWKLDTITTYQTYARRVLENRRQLVNLLTKIKTHGHKIIGYGAPAKGNTLLNYFKIGPDILDYIVDDSPLKQGLFTPGTHIPVVSSSVLHKETADYILILAWNFAQSIMDKLSPMRNKGVKFIIPVPKPKVV